MENLDIISFILNFLITIFIYMFYPVTIYVWKKEIKEDEPKRVAIVNSIIGFLIFIILFLILNRNLNIMSGSPAFFYGYINYLILKSRVKKEIIKYPNEEKETENLKNLISKLEK